MLEVAESLVRCRADEVASLLAGVVVVHGEASVDRAVQRLADAGASFTFPSKLIDAVTAVILDEGFDLAEMADRWRTPVTQVPGPTYELTEPEDPHAGPTVRVIYEEAAT